ncbi:MAG: winged helix-turn-helix transcriptional regulator [Ferruginibacter sp.]
MLINPSAQSPFLIQPYHREENRIIEKLAHPDSKAKVLYRVTPKGIDLLPIVIEIHLWADKYFTLADDKKAMSKTIKKDRPGFIKVSMKELKKV